MLNEYSLMIKLDVTGECITYKVWEDSLYLRYLLNSLQLAPLLTGKSFMASMKEGSDPLQNLSDEQLLDLVKSNDALDKEEARFIKEEREDKEERTKSSRKTSMRLRKTPLEIINRTFFFVFIGGFIFSFVSVYAINRWWFFFYLLSAFSCILYIPNRKALKELIDAWPNIEDLIKNRSLWK